MYFLFRSMNVFFLDPAEPDFTYTNFLDPPEPDFTYTNFFEPHRTRVYLHKLFWNPPNLILPTQTFWDHPEPDFTYTNSFGTPNRISPTLFFHIIRELFIALFFPKRRLSHWVAPHRRSYKSPIIKIKFTPQSKELNCIGAKS